MEGSAIVVVQFILMAISVIANLFGIFMLRKQKGGNANQRLILQNLSSIEIIKTCYDFFSLTTHHYFNGWSKHIHAEVIIAVEISLMTVIFQTFILISLERITFFTLLTLYRYYVTKRVTIMVITFIWSVGVGTGAVLLLLSLVPGYARMYYYISSDILIILLNIITFIVTMKEVQASRRNPILRRNSRRKTRKNVQRCDGNLRIYIVSLLVITSFSCFNAIPDFVFEFHREKVSFLVVSFLWSVGYLVDPFIYIFLNKKVRKEAKKEVRRLSTTAINDLRSKSSSPRLLKNEERE